MKPRINLTLRLVFLLTMTALTGLLGVLLYVVIDGSRRSIIESSSRLRDEAGQRISDEVVSYLAGAEKTLADFEGQCKYGALAVDDPAALEAALFAAVRSNPRLAEVTLTHADALEYDKDGDLDRATGRRWQMSVFRAATDADGSRDPDRDRVITRRVVDTGQKGPDGAEQFAADYRHRNPADGLLVGSFRRSAEAVEDPTEHLTFKTLVRKDLFGEAIWSDLHWSQLSEADDSAAASPTTGPTTGPATVPTTAPAATRPAGPPPRVEVTVQKAIAGADGRFLGVLRVGVLAEQLDAMCQVCRIGASGPPVTGMPINGMAVGGDRGDDDPHRIFICDKQGRLITRVASDDRLEVTEDDELRFTSVHGPPAVAAALKLPALADIEPGRSLGGQVDVGGKRHLVTFRAMDATRTQGWVVGIVAPEDFYLRGLVETRNRLVLASSVVMVVLLLGGLLSLRVVHHGLRRVVTSAGRMHDYDFTPSNTRSMFSDLRAVLESLERAKTAMRAMGKYVPVDLVRRLYQMNREPTLGGDPSDVTLMFTDIKEFTPIAERLAPADLAALLGEYFAALTAAIHENGGIVDKFIGDAVMALWNVPTPAERHPLLGCAAALECLRASRQLSKSPLLNGLPPLATRIGLHRGPVLVGHFGAPDRMSYTVLGDGVNLAARLETLNKQYGTHVIVSETVHDAAAAAFRFRLLDRVVVKGKTHGVRIYELRGSADEPDPGADVVRRYEAALAAYWARDFAAAAELLAGQEALDPPSRVLADRCRELSVDPPPPEWDGVYVASVK